MNIWVYLYTHAISVCVAKNKYMNFVVCVYVWWRMTGHIRMEKLTVQENWPKVGVLSILWTDGWSRFGLTTYCLFIWRKSYWFCLWCCVFPHECIFLHWLHLETITVLIFEILTYIFLYSWEENTFDWWVE